MPARAEKLYVCPAVDGQPGVVMRFPLWWNRSEFLQTYRERAIDTGNPFYDDFGLLLTPGEAMVWDERCRAQFAGDPRSSQPWYAEETRRLEGALRGAQWVVVESYEWESGLD